jgi:adenylate cyclase class IV
MSWLASTTNPFVMPDLATYQDFSAKAHCADVEQLARVLQQLGAKYLGTDYQRDTYYQTDRGKLKLREGNIEHLLIHYERLPDAQGLEQTRVYRYDSEPTPAHLRAVLAGKPVLGIVEKARRIYYLDDIKIHLDSFPEGLQFVEVEVIDREGKQTLKELQQECLRVLALLGIDAEELLTNGYLPTPKS